MATIELIAGVGAMLAISTTHASSVPIQDVRDIHRTSLPSLASGSSENTGISMTTETNRLDFNIWKHVGDLSCHLVSVKLNDGGWPEVGEDIVKIGETNEDPQDSFTNEWGVVKNYVSISCSDL